MKALVDMSTTDLEYLVKKFATEVTEITDQIDERQTRLDKRLQRQADDDAAKAEQEQALQEAQDMLAELQASGASASSITTAENVVADRQALLAGITTSTAYVSDTEAQLIKMQLDELEQGRVLRNNRIAEIETILAA